MKIGFNPDYHYTTIGKNLFPFFIDFVQDMVMTTVTRKNTTGPWRIIQIGATCLVLAAALSCSPPAGPPLLNNRVIPLTFNEFLPLSIDDHPIDLEIRQENRIFIDKNSLHSGKIVVRQELGSSSRLELHIPLALHADYYSSVDIAFTSHHLPSDNAGTFVERELTAVNSREDELLLKRQQQGTNLILCWRLKDEAAYRPERTIYKQLTAGDLHKGSTKIELEGDISWHGDVVELKCILEQFTPVTNSFTVTGLTFLPFRNNVFGLARSLQIDAARHRGFLVDIPSLHSSSVSVPYKCYLSVGHCLTSKQVHRKPFPVIFQIAFRNTKKNSITVLHRQTHVLTNKHWEFKELTIDLGPYVGQSGDIQFSIETDPQNQIEIPEISAFWTQPFLYHQAPVLQKPAPNVILISLDTLRPDILGCYGSPEGLSPALDRFSKKSAVFSEVISQSPSTTSSHASLFVSLFPSQHGVEFSRWKLPPEITSLTTCFAENNWRTGAVTGGIKMSVHTGLNQGFAYYNDREQLGTSLQKYALPWLHRHQDLPWFFFYHTYHTHSPYSYHPVITPHLCPDYHGTIQGNETLTNLPLPDISDADRSYLWALYKTSLREMDTYLAALFRYLETSSYLQRTMVVILSDHGEQFGEQEHLFGHCNSLYDQLLKVPLIIRFPDRTTRPGLYSGQVRLIDVAPTILDYVRFQIPSQMQGRSLLPYLKFNSITSPAVFSEMKFSWPDTLHIDEKISLRSRHAKIILDCQNRSAQVYSLENERETPVPDASGPHTPSIRKLLLQINSFFGQRLPGDFDQVGSEDVSPDPETIRQLETLGYITTAH